MLLTSRHSTRAGLSIRARIEAGGSFPDHAERPSRQLYVLVAAANVEKVKTTGRQHAAAGERSDEPR